MSAVESAGRAIQIRSATRTSQGVVDLSRCVPRIWHDETLGAQEKDAAIPEDLREQASVHER